MRTSMKTFRTPGFLWDATKLISERPPDPRYGYASDTAAIHGALRTQALIHSQRMHWIPLGLSHLNSDDQDVVDQLILNMVRDGASVGIDDLNKLVGGARSPLHAAMEFLDLALKQ